MNIQTTTPQTARVFVQRLSESEKISIRKATPGELEYLGQTRFAADNICTFEMSTAQQLLKAEFVAKSKGDWWVTQTWNT